MENNKIKNICDWLGRWGRTFATVIALLVLIVVVWWHWCSIRAFIWLDFSENSGERSRNLALTLAAILAPVGLFMAYWRTQIANGQAETAIKQTEIAIKQAETSERGLQNDRYQKGAEMLGSGKLAVRVGGIYALERLAAEQPVEYHIQIMNLLCALIRHPSEDAHHSDAAPAGDDDGDLPKCCRDVELAAQVLGLLDSHISTYRPSLLYCSQSMQASEHNYGTWFSVISCPSAQAGANP